jgi:hypothetical protein
LVCYVPPGSLADAAGFKPGDIIVSVGLHPVKSLKDVKDKLNHDEDEGGRRARYLEWTLPPASGETSFETHYSFLLREPDGGVHAVHDVHLGGLFGRATWLRLFREVGLPARLEPRKIEGEEYDSFVALRDAT